MCTAINLRVGSGFAGRNLDLNYDFGQNLLLVPRSQQITFSLGETPLGFSTHDALLGIGVPVASRALFADAMNEHGLWVANLNAPGICSYAASAEDAQAHEICLAPWELTTAILLMCTSVAEFKQKAAQMCIVDVRVADEMPNTTLHWFVADAHESAVAEVQDGKLNVYDNPAHALTNAPDFPYQLNNLRQYAHLSNAYVQADLDIDNNLMPLGVGFGSLGLPGDWSSASRLARVAYLLKTSPDRHDHDKNLAQAFAILSAIAFPYGAATSADGSFEITSYSSVADFEKRAYYVKTYDAQAIIAVAFDSCELDGDTLQTWPLDNELQLKWLNQ